MVSYTEVRAHQAPPSKKQMYAMKTLTKPYQGRTYRVTLSNGHEAVITVPQGYGPDGGEVARLHETALTRYGFTVAGCLMPVLNDNRDVGRVNRWWAVEMCRPFTRVDYFPDGTPDCYEDYEHEYILVEAQCFAGVYQAASVKQAMAQGWKVSAIELRSAPRTDEPSPF